MDEKENEGLENNNNKEAAESENTESKENKSENVEESKQNDVPSIKKKSIWRYPIRIAVIFLIIAIVYIAIIMIEKIQATNSIFENIESEEVSLTEYIVYGNHLNLKGKLNIEDTNIENIKLCFKTVNEENSQEIDLNYSKTDDGITFYTSNLINEGINLEEFNADMYYMFVKITSKESLNKYYTIKNKTKYEDVEYYTITRNGKNKKIDIKFDTYDVDKLKKDYMYLSSNYEKLPDDVYDIVIDPGHGGKDVGAEANRI